MPVFPDTDFVQIRFPGEKAARQIRGGNLENIHPAGQPFDAAGVFPPIPNAPAVPCG